MIKTTDKSKWNDWRWQLQNRITTLEELSKYIELTEEEIEFFDAVAEEYPFAVTPYYLSLIKDPKDKKDPIRLQIVPSPLEIDEKAQENSHPNALNEETFIKGLTHRYEDRVLISVTSYCGVYCRHCMRKRIFKEGTHATPKELLDVYFDYIKSHKNVKDVLISGGDPLTLDNERLKYILDNLSSIEHLEVIRIGSRVPVTLPQRLYDEELLDILSKYDKLWINTHFNHPNEITEDAKVAIRNLLKAGVPVNNQAVLLKDVNDDKETMLELMRKLLTIKVKPQYLFHCDPITGTIHFRTSIEKGLEIMDYMRGRLSGFGIPTYAIDLPSGKGKVPLVPSYFKKLENGLYEFIAFDKTKVIIEE